MKHSQLYAAAALACATLVSSLAHAQTGPVPDHPRVNEVNQRLENQQGRVQEGLANGTMNGKQAARDESHDANIARRESVDEANHGGHLTKGEQHRLKPLRESQQSPHPPSEALSAPTPLPGCA